MKSVTWTDKGGYKRRSLIADEMPDSEAEQGIPLTLIDLDMIDWDEAKREIHNKMVDAGIGGWIDLQGRGDFNLPQVITSVIKPRIIMAMRQMEEYNGN